MADFSMDGNYSYSSPYAGMSDVSNYSNPYYAYSSDYGMDFNTDQYTNNLDAGYQVDADGNLSFAGITIMPDGSIKDPAGTVYSSEQLQDPGVWDKVSSFLNSNAGKTLISSGAGLAGGLSAANAQKQASANAAAQNSKALAQQQNIYNQQREDFAPYRQMGIDGVNQYYSFSQNPAAYLNTPAYQWQKQQIDENMNRQLSARGRSNSTYGMKALANAYGNLGAQEYTNAYNRTLDPIKIGQGAANSTGSAGNVMSNNYQQNALIGGNIATQQGANQASLYSGLGALPINMMTAYNGLNQNQAMTNYINRLG